MRIAALVIGIIAAILGLIAAILALTIGGIGAAAGAQSGPAVLGYAFLGLLFVFLGFLGAGLALAKPKVAGVLLLLTAIGFIFSFSVFAIISGPLFLMASMFAFLGSGRQSKQLPPPSGYWQPQ